MNAAATYTTVDRMSKTEPPRIAPFILRDKDQQREANYLLPFQKEVRHFYLRRSIQILVAAVIFLNFLTSAISAQLLPEDDSGEYNTFMAFEWFYCYAFLVELLINMWGHWWWEFWKSGWNWFDFIIVIISLLALYFPDLPALSVLRLFRAFRVVRLFKRVKQMRKIIEGIMKSLPSLSYAFVAQALITGIWAIMGVDFFGEMIYNGEKGYYFGNFFRACLSLGQITTFDSWSSGIARDIIYEKGTSAAIYFVTFVFICSIIMMNVLVALLLDNYLSVGPEEPEEELLSSEDAMEQLAAYAIENKFEIHHFAAYLKTRAFPDYLANHHHDESKPKDKMEAGDIEMENLDHKKSKRNVCSSLQRIDKALSSVELNNARIISSLVKRRIIPAGGIRITLGSVGNMEDNPSAGVKVL